MKRAGYKYGLARSEAMLMGLVEGGTGGDG